MYSLHRAIFEVEKNGMDCQKRMSRSKNGSSYLNGRRVPIIHSFFPLADPGTKIVEKPVGYIYLPVSSDVIRHITVWLTDQNQNVIDLGEETLTIKFHLRSC